MASAGVPVLLPSSSLPRPSHPTLEWTPKRYLTGPQPPPVDDAKVLEQELAAARQLADGKAVKKTRPRRTVDFNGGMGRWALVCTHPLERIMTLPASLLVTSPVAETPP